MAEIGPEPSEDVRVGVFAIRVWTDAQLPEGVRARITSTVDLSSEETTVTMAKDEDAIVAAIRDWLEAFRSC